MVVMVGCALGCGGDPDPVEPDVLIYTRTLGHRHTDAIETAREVLPAGLAARGLASEFTEDPEAFEAGRLGRRKVVVFLYTSGNGILDAEGKAALESFVTSGGGWVGIHSASDTEYLWPFYQDLVIASYAGHPPIQRAVVDVAAPAHPAMRHIGSPRWGALDEWYDFARNPEEVAEVEVLARVDEATYTGGTMGEHHPIIWAHERLGGRALYSALGHMPERWMAPVYVDHVVGAIAWAANQ